MTAMTRTGWRLVRERARLADTIVAAAATLLAATGIIPLFQDLSWVGPALVVVVVIAVVGAGCRGLGMPLPMIPVAEALAMVASLTALYASSLAWAGIVPTSEAWRSILELVRQGLVDAEQYGAPVPSLTGMTLLAVGGIGIVAFSVDSLFVSVRSPILAGLPLALMYLAPAMINAAGPPWWALPLAGMGWLLVLAADQRDRVRQWGGLSSSERVRGLASTGRRIGVIGLAAASLVAVALPLGSWAPWRTGEGEGPGGAGAPAPVVLDPLVSMRRDLIQSNDTQVLTYRTSAPEPGYLRVAALESFDGSTWLPRPGLASGRDPGLPLPGNVLSGRVAVDANNRVTNGDSIPYDITVTNLMNAYLPLPYPVSAIDELDDLGDLGSDWRMDPSTGIAFSDGVPATGVAYRVAALDPRVEADQLRTATAPDGGLWPQLNLPGGLPPVIAQTAREVTAEARTPYEKAVALQRWFRNDGGFTYSTGVRSGADGDYLGQFLVDRIGYCEQFAGAMAVMARTLGIPSRVVVGFTQGSRVDDETWKVTVRDAHAWPELWFDGVGWVRFEPTPRAQSTLQAPEYAPETDAQVPNDPRIPRGLDDQPVAGSGGSASTSWWGPVRTSLVVVGLLAGLLLLGWILMPMVVRRVRRVRRLHRARYADLVEGAWAEIADTAVDLGQPWSGARTPRQAAERLSRGMPGPANEALQRLRRELEQVRYGRPGAVEARLASTGDSSMDERKEAVRADARTVIRDLTRRVRWQTRVAAYCWPSSERRRQRSSMRFMNPGPAGRSGAAASSSVPSDEERRVKAE